MLDRYLVTCHRLQIPPMARASHLHPCSAQVMYQSSFVHGARLSRGVDYTLKQLRNHKLSHSHVVSEPVLYGISPDRLRSQHGRGLAADYPILRVFTIHQALPWLLRLMSPQDRGTSGLRASPQFESDTESNFIWTLASFSFQKATL